MNIRYRSVFSPKLSAKVWGHADENIQKMAVSSKEESKSKTKKYLFFFFLLTAPFPIRKSSISIWPKCLLCLFFSSMFPMVAHVIPGALSSLQFWSAAQSAVPQDFPKRTGEIIFPVCALPVHQVCCFSNQSLQWFRLLGAWRRLIDVYSV